MTSRLFVASAIALAALAAACNSGGGGNKPVVTAFQATPFALPVGGALVTFSWTATGADTLAIAPDVGAVTGSSHVATITQGGTYTLIAHNKHGDTTGTTTITVGAPMTITGVLRTLDGFPADGVIVTALGQGLVPVVTSTTGAFSLDGVVAPYDLLVVDSAAPVGTIYKGLTLQDIVLPVPIFSGGHLTAQSGTFAGTITGGATLPLPGTAKTDLSLWSPEGVQIQTTASLVNGTWSGSANWKGPLSTQVDIRVLQSNSPVAGQVTYSGFAARKSTITAGQNLVGQDLALAPVTTTTVSGTFQVPPGYLPQAPVPALVFDHGAGFGITDLIALPGVTTTTANWSQVFPVVPTTRLATLSAGQSPTGDEILLVSQPLPAAGTNVAVHVPIATHMLLPPTGGTVSSTTRFSVAAASGAINIFAIEGPTSALVIVTDRPSLSLSEFDLSEAGLSPASGAGGWAAFSIGDYVSIDELADPAAPVRDFFLSFPSTPYSVTFQP
jgi:hypothetical protein